LAEAVGKALNQPLVVLFRSHPAENRRGISE
jgi:hypothetical protein